MGKNAVLSTELKRLTPLIRQVVGSTVFWLRWGSAELTEDIAEQSIRRIMEDLLSRRTEAYGLVKGGPEDRLLIWEQLDWDSRILGRGCGRIDLLAGAGLSALLSSWRERAADLGMEYITCRLTSGHTLPDGAGFEKLEDIIYLAGSTKAPAPELTVRRAVPEDLERVAAIASGSYRFDRFHSDPFFSAVEADRIHAEWAASCFGGRADGILVAEVRGVVRGFCACISPMRGSGQPGWIDMLAVDPEARRAGLGKSLVLGARRYFAESGIEWAALCTQDRNRPAVKLYHNQGFMPYQNASTFRLRLHGSRD
ncbi:MAG: GNAT family N-acetyltransferase [Candidatus Latescibacteria bacterium]|nr:GNAT family N-acetyltransferase [bacterium]MBD3423509.1 GNAT family N-acetyltransferase [Candidatus Latescibacterota bacterium]